MINKKIRNLDNPILKPKNKKDLIVDTDINIGREKRNFNKSKIITITKKILSKILLRSPFKKLIIPVVAISLIYSAFTFYSSEKKTNVNANSNAKAESLQLTLVEKVGKLILLPDYAPEIFKVSNVETLKAKQPFFEKAENDDTVFVYKNEVILYRESINKIINLAPVSKNKSGVTTIQNNI